MSSPPHNTISHIEMQNVLLSMNNHIDTTTTTCTDSIIINVVGGDTCHPSNQNSNIPNPIHTSNKQEVPTTTIAPISLLPAKKLSKKQLIIKTRCGQLEFTKDRIIAFFFMFLSIITLFIMAFLSAGTLVSKTDNENKTYNHVTRIVRSLVRLNKFYTILMGRQQLDTRMLNEINETMLDGVKSQMSYLFNDIPSYSNTRNYTRSSVIKTISGYYDSVQVNHDYLYGRAVSSGESVLDSEYFYSNYKPSVVNFTQSLDLALIMADKAADNEDSYITMSAQIDLILVVFVLLIIVPGVIVILIKSVVNDNKFMDKLQKADARSVIEIISSTHHLQLQFKELCSEHCHLSSFLFMERVELYNEHCHRIFQLHDEVEEPNVPMDVSKSMCLEIDDLETRKFELAFEILTEYLDVENDHHFLGWKVIGGRKVVERVKKVFDAHSTNLPEDLFVVVQANVSLSLLPLYKLFNSQQKRKRHERRVKIIEHNNINNNNKGI